jgi:ABC-type transport system involved in cytochrome c biogenesis permease component
MTVALGGSLVLGAYLAAISKGFSEVIAIAAVSAWSGLSLLVAAFSSSRSIAQERMSGTWEALIMSRLGGRGIVLGKLLGTLLPLWTVGVVLLPMVLLLLAASWPRAAPEALYTILAAYGMAIGGGTAAASLGLYCSMRCRTVASAQFLMIVLGVIITMVAQFAAICLMFLASDMPTAYGHDVLYRLVHLTLLLLPGLLMLVDLLTRFDTLERYHRRS